MSRIAVIGGTGYAGSHIVEEGVRRGHTVVSVARKPPAERIDGATYIEGTLLDAPGLATDLGEVDVVVVSVAPRADMLGNVRPGVASLDAALPADVRLGVIGGAGGAQVSKGGPNLIDTEGFPDFVKPESNEMIGVFEDLQASESGRDWFFIHPAARFGASAPGERTGRYRDGGEVLVTAEDGDSSISGADFAVAIVDEIENAKHSRERFAVGY